MTIQIKRDSKPVAAFQEKNGDNGAEFSKYFRGSRVFAACTLFLRNKLMRKSRLYQVSPLI